MHINCKHIFSSIGLCIASTCVFAGVSTTQPKAVDTSLDRSLMAFEYDQMYQAFAQGNIDSVREMLLPTYTEVDPDGKTLDRNGICAKLSGERRQITSISTQVTITDVSPLNNSITVNAHLHATGTGAKKVLFVTFHGKFVNDMIVQDTWTNSPSGWHLACRRTIFDQSTQSAG